jgi:hypothetical protein
VLYLCPWIYVYKALTLHLEHVCFRQGGTPQLPRKSKCVGAVIEHVIVLFFNTALTNYKKNRGPGGALGAAGHASRGSIGTQRAADVGRYGESSRAGPSVIGKLVCHVKRPVQRTTPSRGGARYLDRGTTRWNSRAPARQGPSHPEETRKACTRYTLYPQRFNWFESTPRHAPRVRDSDQKLNP